MAGREKVGMSDNGRGKLLVHRWRTAAIGFYVSRCGAVSTKGIHPNPSGTKCKRCFRPLPPDTTKATP